MRTLLLVETIIFWHIHFFIIFLYTFDFDAAMKFSLTRCLQLHRELGCVSYKTIFLVKKGRIPKETLTEFLDLENAVIPASKEEISFFACIRNKKIRIGVHLLLLSVVIILAMDFGFNSWTMSFFSDALLVLGAIMLALGFQEFL